MHEVEVETLQQVQAEFITWSASAEDPEVLYSIALYLNEQDEPIAISFYAERSVIDAEDPTPYVKRKQTLMQVKEYFATLDVLIKEHILPCVICTYPAMGLVVRSISAERAQQLRTQQLEQRAQHEAQQAKVQAQRQQAKDQKKSSYKSDLEAARRDIEEQHLNPLQAIRRLPKRSNKTKGRKVRYDWSHLEKDYEKYNGNIATVARNMGCTSAAVRRQLKEHKIGIYKNK